MFRNLKSSEKLLLSLWKTPKLCRTLLSQAYQCQEAWNKRLQSPLLQKIKPVDFFLELDHKFQTQNRVSAVDIDIFSNSITNNSQIQELEDLLYKLRMSRETTFTLDSTHHAVVRFFLETGQAEQLLDVLNDRLNYGIFCDYFCYNILMDHFIEKGKFGLAAKTASLMMLQEEYEHPISNALAIYSCHKYLENPDSWQEVDPETLKDPEPKEEVKIRVRYLRNPYFDDHFDLWKPSDLTGKTLYLIGQTMHDPLGRTCQLRGLLLYRKLTDAIALLKKWKQEGVKEVIYRDVLPLIKKDVPEIFGEEASDEAKELQQLLADSETANLYQGNLGTDIENLAKTAIDTYSQEDIDKQIKIYNEWEEKRMTVLKEHLAELDRQTRLAKIEQIKQELAEQEQVLTFFENKDKIELTIEQKLEKEKKIFGEESEVVQNLDEKYVPPEIVRKRQSR
ncbi:hypothetical protein TSAR_003803 [Trichomalopsis sarcophagae]|uniref:28S ribosomal protein S27, mitochondrial n=1 Tax=Trichomalopsis sarcophagae TaxID=543379 RepID=A0A232F402_9HYME|nr:hypothetical protein TSAR_003803 [Trichomalopsis sarcophagae]